MPRGWRLVAPHAATALRLHGHIIGTLGVLSAAVSGEPDRAAQGRARGCMVSQHGLGGRRRRQAAAGHLAPHPVGVGVGNTPPNGGICSSTWKVVPVPCSSAGAALRTRGSGRSCCNHAVALRQHWQPHPGPQSLSSNPAPSTVPFPYPVRLPPSTSQSAPRPTRAAHLTTC